MSNHIWTADGKIVDINVKNKTTEVIKNVIEPFSIFNLKVEDANKIKDDFEKTKKLEQEKQKEQKKILFIKPNSNDSLSNFCFYRDKYQDGTFGSYNNPPIIEITGTKCPPNETKNSLGMRVNNIRSVNNLNGSGTLRDKNGLSCEINRKDINDSYLNSLYFGDCITDPLYWKEEKDEKKLQEYRKSVKSEKISDYLPKLNMPPDNNSLNESKYTTKISTVLSLNPDFKDSYLNKTQKDKLSTILHSNECLGGTSTVENSEKKKSIVNTLTNFFNTDGKKDTVSGKEGIHVNLYGNKCPPNAKSYFGIDVQMLETTDKNGNVRTYKVPTVSTIPMINKSPDILEYDKDEKCQIDLNELNPILKNVLVGDCDNPPIALKKGKTLNKDNNIKVYNDVMYTTKQDIRPPRKPGLAGYDIKLAPPKCNYSIKKNYEIKKMLENCPRKGLQDTHEDPLNQYHPN